MSGTIMGGRAAADTNKELYGSDFYKRIGKLGGSVKTKKGFAISGLARVAGAKGGRISKRIPTIDIEFTKQELKAMEKPIVYKWWQVWR